MWFEAPKVAAITSTSEDCKIGMFTASDITMPVLNALPATCAARWVNGRVLTSFVLYWPSVSGLQIANPSALRACVCRHHRTLLASSAVL